MFFRETVRPLLSWKSNGLQIWKLLFLEIFCEHVRMCPCEFNLSTCLVTLILLSLVNLWILRMATIRPSACPRNRRRRRAPTATSCAGTHGCAPACAETLRGKSLVLYTVESRYIDHLDKGDTFIFCVPELHCLYKYIKYIKTNIWGGLYNETPLFIHCPWSIFVIFCVNF